MLREWRQLVLVAVVALAAGLSFQGTRGIYHTTEARYAGCARETMLSGNIAVPVLDGEGHWTKPPLTYWAIMGGIRLFGQTPFAARFYLVLALLLSALAVYWTGSLVWGPDAGMWAGLVFATSPYVVASAHVVSTDMLVVLWVAISLAAFQHGKTHGSSLAHLLGWLSLGLAFLTKGPPAMLVPAAVLVCALAMAKGPAAGRRRPWIILPGVLLFLVVGLGWYTWAALAHPGLFSYWIGEELVARNLTDEFRRNPGFDFVVTNYLPIMLFGSGPWLLLALFGLRGTGWSRNIRDHLLSRESPPSVARFSLLVGGIIFPLLVFALSRSKLPLYLAPVFVPLSLLLGRRVEQMIAQGHFSRRTAFRSAGLLLLLVIAAKAAYGLPERHNDMTSLAKRLQPMVESKSPHALYVVGGRNLPGLVFHLPHHPGLVQPDDFSRHAWQSAARNEKIVYLARQRRLDDLVGGNSGLSGVVDFASLGPHWAVLWTLVDEQE